MRIKVGGTLYPSDVIERSIWHILSLLNTDRVTLWTAKWCLFQVLNVAGALIVIQPTCQQALFSGNLAQAPQPIPSWNMDDCIPRLEEFSFFFLNCGTPINCADLPLIKKYTLIDQEAKHCNKLHEPCWTVIQSANDKEHVFILSLFWWTGLARPSYTLTSRKYVSGNDTSIPSLTLNHCQSLCALGSLGNRNRSSITSPPICLALTREVHAVFMPVWDGFKLFSYQKAHSDILFERHRKPQILQPPFNHMSWFIRPESDLLPRKSCRC